MSKFVLALLILLFPLSAVSQSDVIRRMEGWYIVPSKYCSLLEEGTLKPCDPVPNDTLSIERIDDLHAQIELYSLQTNGHECEVSGVADRVAEKLVYTEKDQLGRGDQFEIAIVGNVIKLKVLTEAGPAHSPFCGARASLDLLEFPLNEAKPEMNRTGGVAVEKPDCINASIAFDGVTPVTYATVVAQLGERAYLHRDYPRDCDDRNDAKCQSKAYLVNGDTVAVGKTCGSWTYVQFVGPKTASVGWVASGELAPLPAAPTKPPTTFSSPRIEGAWRNRSQDFSLVVWVMGSVVCGYLDETDERGKGNDSFIVGRLENGSAVVEYDSTWGDGRGTASLSLLGDKLKWHVLKEIVGGKTPDDEVLRRGPISNMSNPETKSKCDEWRPLIEGGKTDVLNLRELGGYKE
jgi:hypothetical protein